MTSAVIAILRAHFANLVPPHMWPPTGPREDPGFEAKLAGHQSETNYPIDRT